MGMKAPCLDVMQYMCIRAVRRLEYNGLWSAIKRKKKKNPNYYAYISLEGEKNIYSRRNLTLNSKKVFYEHFFFP